MKISHKGLDLAGIILTYLGSIFTIIWYSFIFADVYFGEDPEFIPLLLLMLTSIASFIITVLYHFNVTKNYILVGVLAIFSSILGGIFILVGQAKPGSTQSNVHNRNDLSNLEDRLRQLHVLLSKGIITKEEYDKKRQSIIDEH